MSKVYRRDAIKLNENVKPEDFNEFMIKTFIPFFSGMYQHATRVTVATLENQVLLKDAKHKGQFIWLNIWNGPLTALNDESFGQASMIEKPETDKMLKRLSEYGHRRIADILETVEIN